MDIIKINGKYYREYGVTMWFSQEVAPLVLRSLCMEEILLSTKNDKYETGFIDYFHLYITSDEEPKNGDQVITDAFGAWEFKDEGNGSAPLPSWANKKTCKKIIATTDKSLGLPGIPPDFIDICVKPYNDGAPIKKCMVEMEDYLTEDLALKGSFTNYRIKTDNQNCIKIIDIKFTGYDIKELKEDLEILISQNEDDFDRGKGKYILRNWIERNL